MTDIKLDHLNDRELLILAVQGVNETKEHLKKQNGRITALESCVDEIERERIRPLENWRNVLAGAVAVIVVLIPVALWLAREIRP